MRKGMEALAAGIVMLLLSATSGIAQHTVVTKNGVGGRIETDYNAAGKATEMRTMGPEGKVQQKVNYDYLPDYYIAQQTDTTYWPNGELRKVSHHTYDENTNFTGEFIRTFDETGKQIAGHKLTHDPGRGTYRCAEWNTGTGDYRKISCPSGDEEGGGGAPEGPKKFSYDEVMKQLDAARKSARRAQEKVEGADRAMTASTSSSPGAQNDVGLVLPAQLHRGERISGILVDNPGRYSEIPEVTITHIRVPFAAEGDGSRLHGWLFEAAGEAPQLADGPITLVVPDHGALTITLRQAGNSANLVSQTLTFPEEAEKPPSSSGSHSFEAPAICMKGELCIVSGRFGGDSRKTYAAFEDRPAVIIAETQTAAYVSVPEATEAGARPLFISEESAEGSKIVALPVVVGQFLIRNNGREVKADESVITFPTLEGPSAIPDDAWRAGKSSAASFEKARRLIPGFKLNGEACEPYEEEASEKREGEEEAEAREKDREEDRRDESEEKEGRILLVVRNLAPAETSLHGAHDETLAFCLGDEAFQRGDFKYNLRVDVRKAGKIDVSGHVISFLAPVTGQEFVAKPAH